MTTRKGRCAALVEIDPTTHPILATHWLVALPNWKSLSGVVAGILDDTEVERSLADGREVAA